MGHFTSKSKVTPAILSSQKEVSTIARFPSYYTELSVTNKDYIQANLSWKYILESNGQHYLRMKDTKQITEHTCIAWFYKILYNRLFYILPEVKPLFHADINKQGKMMTTMITDMLESYYNPRILDVMQDIALRHIGYGIHAYHFVIMGDVIFYSLKYVLGPDYTTVTDAAWKRMYSSILRIIVPLFNKKEENRIINNLIEEYFESESNDYASESVEKNEDLNSVAYGNEFPPATDRRRTDVPLSSNRSNDSGNEIPSATIHLHNPKKQNNSSSFVFSYNSIKPDTKGNYQEMNTKEINESTDSGYLVLPKI